METAKLVRSELLKSIHYLRLLEQYTILVISYAEPLVPENWTQQECEEVIIWAKNGGEKLPIKIAEYIQRLNFILKRKNVN